MNWPAIGAITISSMRKNRRGSLPPDNNRDDKPTIIRDIILITTLVLGVFTMIYFIGPSRDQNLYYIQKQIADNEAEGRRAYRLGVPAEAMRDNNLLKGWMDAKEEDLKK